MGLAVVPVSSEVQDRTVHKQLAVMEALRRLGFAPGEVFVSWTLRPNTVVQVADRSFTISYPHSVHPKEECDWLLEWLGAVDRWDNEMTEADRERMYRQHVSKEIVGLLTVGLRARGIRIRRSEN
jgi:hypothetical protein